MFQYAFGRYLAYKHNTELKLDLSFFANQIPGKKNHVFRNYDLGIFNIQENIATEEEILRFSKRTKNDLLDRLLNRIFGVKRGHLREPHFHFSEAAFNSPDNTYLSGYWQTSKYFAEIESIIRSDFTFKEEIAEKAKPLLHQIKSTNSICLNVRRGDFVTNSFHGSYGVDYFQKADEIIKQRVSDYTYYIFSDEIEWCEANLKFEAPTVFVSHEFAGKKFQDYLRLMSSCQHFIIPNSSFAWWAVWFNQNKEKIVIAPKAWFSDSSMDTSDLVPSEWIRI